MASKYLTNQTSRLLVRPGNRRKKNVPDLNFWSFCLINPPGPMQELSSSVTFLAPANRIPPLNFDASDKDPEVIQQGDLDNYENRGLDKLRRGSAQMSNLEPVTWNTNSELSNPTERALGFHGSLLPNDRFLISHKPVPHEKRRSSIHILGS